MLRVLIVADEPLVRLGIRRIIDWTTYGFRITGEAQNGLEAIELLKANEYDVIMVDIKMPTMNGLEFIGYVRGNISKRMKFIILSQHYDFEYVQEAINFHVTSYLLKPVQTEQLREVLAMVKRECEKQKKIEKVIRSKEKIMIDYYFNSLITGKCEKAMVEDAISLLRDRGEYQYIYIGMDSCDETFDLLAKEEKNKLLWELTMHLQSRYEGGATYIFGNMTRAEKSYSIGIVATPKFYGKIRLTEEEFFGDLKECIREYYSYRIVINSGTKVPYMRDLVTSYQEAKNIPKENSNEPTNVLLAQIEKEVNKHYKENLSLKTLSEKYYMNSAYLGQLFKREYGVYFKDYLNRIRVEKASKMLLQTNYKIYEIAKSVGYNNTDHFINTFTKEKGMTPSKYRKIRATSSLSK